MDFRLLQTAYKVYMKVIAARRQAVIGTPIGESQQEFVHGRQMLKTVMMMLAVLATANGEPELAAALSHVILLLDFRKAYDTVAREFLFLALLKFGFSEAFVNMLRRLHDGTTARVLVNGELSEEMEVTTGIRQGCPLAPLLFILAAEVLALAIQQDTQVRGIEIPGGAGERHEFSAFVDDSTVFLDQAQQLPRFMQIVTNFCKISGLHVQPTKSRLIFRNTAVKLEEYEGIPVLAHGETVGYLGYAVGTGSLTNANWAEIIRGIQRRLATATQVATSIENRVTLLNVIMLPSVLFTAAVFEMTNWAVKQLVNMQKQFLWRQATGTEASRHEINPGLVHAPKAAGGVGLASIPRACKTQRVKHAMIWLIQKKDRYFAAWKAWMFRGAHQEMQAGLTPRQTLVRQPNRSTQTPGTRLTQLLGEWIQPRMSSTGEQIDQYRADMAEFEQDAISWGVRDEWLIELPRELPQSRQEFTTEDRRFWPTYRWYNNPWIRDREGRMLAVAKFDKINKCALGDLLIRRTGERTYSMRIPVHGKRSHQQAKLLRWGLAILMNSPSLEMGSSLTVQRDIEARHMMKLELEYRWEVTTEGTVVGTVIAGTGQQHDHLELQQQDDGLHWSVKEHEIDSRQIAEDQRKLQRRQHYGSIVFFAHPRCHGITWSVPDSIANQHVGKVLKQQPFKQFKGGAISLDTALDGLDRAVQRSTWQAAALEQTPKQVWAHQNEITAYQVWVAYKVAVRQLNLYHEGRRLDNSCQKVAECQGRKETVERMFWMCSCARVTWQLVIAQWTEEQWTEEVGRHLQANCATSVVIQHKEENSASPPG